MWAPDEVFWCRIIAKRTTPVKAFIDKKGEPEVRLFHAAYCNGN
jgi:hypothetical protein